MSKLATQTPIVNAPVAPAATSAPKVLTQAEQDQADGNAAALAYSVKVALIVSEGRTLKALALNALLVAMAESANSLGRPSQATHAAFTFALLGTDGGFARRTELARMAIAIAKRDGKAKACALMSAKGNGHDGTAKYRFQMPVQMELAIG